MMITIVLIMEVVYFIFNTKYQHSKINMGKTFHYAPNV
jgi:hypothetical protein